jgi:hypothetical protein
MATVNKVEYVSAAANTDTINGILENMNTEGYKLIQVVQLGATLLLFFEGKTNGRQGRVSSTEA